MAHAPSISPTPEPAGQSYALSRRTWAFALLAALAAGLLRVAFADRRGFWLDEYFTLNAAKMSLHDMIENRLGAGHSPLYFLYARLGLLIGSTERTLRLTSALASGALVLALTGLMGELNLRRALPWLWGLAIVEPYWISVGMEYRYTMPLIAVAAGTAWAAVRYAGRPEAARGTVLALAAGLLLWTHGSAPFFIAGLLVFLVWDGWATARARAQNPAPGRLEACAPALARAWPLLAAFALAVPFYYLIRNHPSNNPKGEVVRAKEVLKDLVDVVFFDHKLWFEFLHWRHHTWLFNLEVAVLGSGVYLTWRELRRAANPRAGRLLASTLAAIPLLMFAFCLAVRNFQGPVRYIAAFTIPATVCLAVAAAAATRPGWARWLFVCALALVLVFQTSAAALDRGDRHRDAIIWLKENHRDPDPIVVTVTQMNGLALRFYGLNARDTVKGGFDPGDSVQEVADRIKKAMAGAGRGLYIRYHSKVKILEAMEDLTEQGFFKGHRQWNVAGKLWVGAVIRDARELPWLEALPDPRKDWGPAQAGE